MRATRAGRVRVWTPVITTGILLLALTHPARADADIERGRAGERLVIFPMRAPEGDLDRLPARLTRVLERVTEARGMKVTMLQVSLDDTALMAGCESPENVSCHELILGQLDADAGMTSEVAPAGEDRLVVTVRYLDGKSRPAEQRFEVSRANAAKELEGALPTLFGETVAPTFQENIGPASSDRAAGFSHVQRGPWFALGGGGALMGAGAIFWLTASLGQGDIDDAPTETAADLERLAELERGTRTRATVGNVLFFSGLAVAALGSYLVLRQALSPGPATAADSPPASAGLGFAPVPMPGGVGVTFSMEWQ